MLSIFQLHKSVCTLIKRLFGQNQYVIVHTKILKRVIQAASVPHPHIIYILILLLVLIILQFDIFTKGIFEKYIWQPIKIKKFIYKTI